MSNEEARDTVLIIELLKENLSQRNEKDIQEENTEEVL